MTGTTCLMTGIMFHLTGTMFHLTGTTSPITTWTSPKGHTREGGDSKTTAKPFKTISTGEIG
ncbi:unnamed protein product [Callosobruchus maculatus]|uniref:Uncharacterized protein n=1 Tax=Callosobruchus maculatus TaxID=64391 RepID=A0A653DP32_CALMS|nr:unnamed protein product [Callosobruchus maculatus]